MQKGALLNGMVLALLAAGTATASFFAFTSASPFEQKGWVLDGEMAFDQNLDTSTVSTARINGRDSVTLMANTEATVQFDEVTHQVNVDLSRGTVVFSTVADDVSVRVTTPFATVDSQHSTAVVSLSDELTVQSITHPSLVSFTLNGETLNAMNVPNAYRLKVSSSKVTSLLGKLRLTKLLKEFPVFPLADGDVDADVSEVLASIEQSYNNSSVAFLNSVQDRSDFGPSLTGVGGVLNDTYSSFRDALTVLPAAENHLSELRKADALIFAMTNYLYGDASVADLWLGQWSSATQDLTEVQDLYSSMFFVLPGDELYPVKAAAARLLYTNEDSLSALRRQFAQIESLLDRASPVEAGQAYFEYKTEFQAALDSGAFDSPEGLLDISREYVILEQMLRSNAVFYDKNSVALLQSLEEKILTLAGSAQDLDEERQSFVQSKLRFLSNLFSFVEDKKLDIDVASDLANELIFEANTYMNSLSKQVAVADYFKTQLQDAELSVELMNTPEFYSYDSFAAGLEAYKAKQADLVELNAYIQSIRTGQDEAADMTEEDALTQVEKDLFSKGIQYSAVVSLGDNAHRLYTIEGARTAGYSFQAKYDRASQILYDVVVGDLHFSTGLTLADASKVIAQAMSSQTPTDEDTTTPESTSGSTTSLTESVALQLIRSQWTDADLEPDDFTFTVVDVKENTFSFEGSMTAAALPVSGSYDADTQKCSEIVWELNGTPETLPDTTLSNLEEAVYETYVALSAAQ